MTTGSQPAASRRQIIRLMIAILVILVLSVLFLLSPLSPLHYCSAQGCFDSLEVTFSRLPPAKYTIMVISSTGEVRRATCVPGEDNSKTINAYPAGPICQPDSVVFYDFAPQSVQIQVIWQGGYATLSGQPTYHSFRPNGALCAPRCRRATVQVQVP